MAKSNWWVLHAQEEGDGSGSGGGASGAGDAAPAPGDAGKGGEAPAGADGSKGASADAAGTPPTADANKAFWPDTWREKWAGEDKAKRNIVSRYASPEAALDALAEAKRLISSGELKRALPKDAKPEEVAAWRKENGIPEAPEKYDLKFDDGLVIGEEDKPVIEGFLKTAHGRNMTPDQVKDVVRWYYQEITRQTDERHAQDKREAEETEEALREEWGAEFKPNKNAVENLLATFPAEVRELLKGARLADGRGVFNHPEVLRGFVALAREVNPASSLVPAGAADVGKTLDDEIGKIEATMRKNRAEYNRDAKMQERYRELLTAREKFKARRAA